MSVRDVISGLYFTGNTINPRKAILQRHASFILALLRAGADPLLQDRNGSTALHLATPTLYPLLIKAYPGMVRDYPAISNQMTGLSKMKDKNGLTPLLSLFRFLSRYNPFNSSRHYVDDPSSLAVTGKSFTLSIMSQFALGDQEFIDLFGPCHQVPPILLILTVSMTSILEGKCDYWTWIVAGRQRNY